MSGNLLEATRHDYMSDMAGCLCQTSTMSMSKVNGVEISMVRKSGCVTFSVALESTSSRLLEMLEKDSQWS